MVDPRGVVALAGLISFSTAMFGILRVYNNTVPKAASGNVEAIGDGILAMVGILLVFALGGLVYLIDA